MTAYFHKTLRGSKSVQYHQTQLFKFSLFGLRLRTIFSIKALDVPYEIQICIFLLKLR
jgi:hypothetical protein